MKQYFIYILTNKSGTLYIGITNNLTKRIHEHKTTENNTFTSKYKINKLIYFEKYSDVNKAITREKQLKTWSRKKKINLIKTTNPTFKEIEAP